MTFGQRVQLVRKKRNLTQSELGSQIGMVANLVSKYERDGASPSIEIAARFSKVLNVSLDYLILGDSQLTEEGEGAVQYKLKQLEMMSAEDKSHVMAVIDAFITKERLKVLMG